MILYLSFLLLKKDSFDGDFMPHSIKTVTPLPNYQLQIHFRCGRTKRYDLKPMIEMVSIYKFFLVEQKLFSNVKISEDAHAVFWNEYIDIGCEELWRGGKDVKSAFDALLSCADAAALWNIDESTLRKAVSDGRFVVGIDIMKFGKQWIITLKAMEKHFGSLDHSLANRVTKRKLF